MVLGRKKLGMQDGQVLLIVLCLKKTRYSLGIMSGIRIGFSSMIGLPRMSTSTVDNSMMPSCSSTQYTQQPDGPNQYVMSRSVAVVAMIMRLPLHFALVEV